MTRHDLNLAIIGNCTISALIDRRAAVVWSCFPRFDGDPYFHALLGHRDGPGHGVYEIVLENFTRSEQRYIENTAVLVTTMFDQAGSSIEVTDFAPRFHHYGRAYRPTSIVRILRPLSGAPRIRIRLRPSYGYGASAPEQSRGSNHIRYVSPGLTLRLTTNAPVSYVMDEVPFVLQQPVSLIFGPDEPLQRDVGETAREFCERTTDYWREYSKHLSIPFEWQDAVIRAAITLKLCSFEETGAIIAAMSTSIPEAPDSGRTWDYRYCWLRDSYFVVQALNRLGVTETLERYLLYISNLVASAEDGYLQPVYAINLDATLDEQHIESLPGYRGMGPVRTGNLAHRQIQNDGYGSAILAVTQVFFDQRLRQPGALEFFHWLEKLGEQAAARYDQPDSGLWELRSQERVHTFSSVMCWAACDRLAKIASQLNLPDRTRVWRERADAMHRVIVERAWSEEHQTFVSSFDDEGIDASLLLLHDLGFIAATDPKFTKTVEALERALRTDGLMFRYTEDDFGVPASAFAVCTFWYIDALAAMGRMDEARRLFEEMLGRRNHVGLLSEDIDPATGELWGNFPQTYSMVGLINSATRLSRSWEKAF